MIYMYARTCSLLLVYVTQNTITLERFHNGRAWINLDLCSIEKTAFTCLITCCEISSTPSGCAVHQKFCKYIFHFYLHYVDYDIIRFHVSKYVMIQRKIKSTGVCLTEHKHIQPQFQGLLYSITSVLSNVCLRISVNVVEE